MYAVFVSGGKQHRARPGDLMRLEKLEGDVGSKIEFDRVLMLGGEGDAQVGQPTVPGAKITAEIVRQDRAKKVLVFKFRKRKNYRRLRGHRQHFTDVRITGIQVD